MTSLFECICLLKHHLQSVKPRITLEFPNSDMANAYVASLNADQAQRACQVGAVNYRMAGLFVDITVEDVKDPLHHRILVLEQRVAQIEGWKPGARR